MFKRLPNGLSNFDYFKEYFYTLSANIPIMRQKQFKAMIHFKEQIVNFFNFCRKFLEVLKTFDLIKIIFFW